MSKCYDNPEYDDTYSDIQNTWNQHPKVEQEHETKVMKNLHILPTDKPSRLACDFDKLILNSRLLSPILYKTQNIYIASDEEINQQTKPCWCINTIKNTWDADLSYYQGSMPQYHYKGFKKIILTTDQDLIKDGVQAIDDEFLEWFVKNPSYKEVKVIKHLVWEEYKIIIPKKEPFTAVGYETLGIRKEPTVEGYDSVAHGYQPEPKQETLEKFINKQNTPDGGDQFSFEKGIEIGAKWRQERSYSEEEVINRVPKDEHEIYTRDDYFNDEFPKEEQSTKERILSETSDEVKKRVRDRANSLVNKEETLSEAALKYSSELQYFGKESGFRAGAKWQQERSYSEEDMIEFAYNYMEERRDKGARAMNPELLIKQFKKK